MKVWIARDMSGELAMFSDRPTTYDVGADEEDFIWYSKLGGEDIPQNLYPEITFDNSPKLVTI